MLDVKRREFIALVGGGCVLLTAKVRRARGQQPAKVPRIGILDDGPMWQPFRHALRELGYIEGQNIAYEYRYGEGAPDRLATAAAELMRRPVDLIATYGTQATRAARQATAAIPIVMIGVGDPVRADLVASLARPGGNITGNTVLTPDLGPKRLQILREVIPNVKRVVYLANPDNASNMAALADTKIAASAVGTILIPVEARVVGDFDGLRRDDAARLSAVGHRGCPRVPASRVECWLQREPINLGARRLCQIQAAKWGGLSIRAQQHEVSCVVDPVERPYKAPNGRLEERQSAI